MSMKGPAAAAKGAAAVALGLLALSSAPARAGLIGDTISGTFDFPCATCTYGSFSYSINPFVVNGSVETALTVDLVHMTDVDFGDHSLVLTALDTVNYAGAAYNGPEFTVISGNPFGAVTNVTTSGGQSVTADVSGGTLFVNLAGAGFSNGDTITVTFGSLPVPEPASMGLLAAGLLGLPFLRRRKLR